MEFGIEFSGIQVQWMEDEYFVGNLRVGNVKEIKLTYHKPREMRAMGSMVDSNYASNKDDRRSVLGAIFTIEGNITKWMSKTQASVPLPSTESEYYIMDLPKFGECVLIDKVLFVELTAETQLWNVRFTENIEPKLDTLDNTVQE
jgi:hypothetical protein